MNDKLNKDANKSYQNTWFYNLYVLPMATIGGFALLGIVTLFAQKFALWLVPELSQLL